MSELLVQAPVAEHPTITPKKPMLKRRVVWGVILVSLVVIGFQLVSREQFDAIIRYLDDATRSGGSRSPYGRHFERPAEVL